MRIYTKKGDDGSTGLLYGGRVRKDDPIMRANGALDEAQAALGLARAETGDPRLDEMLIDLERELYVLMAEVATLPENRQKLEEGVSRVNEAMVVRLEARIDELGDHFDMPAEFVVPGGTRVAAALDLARTVVRRAERELLGCSLDDSLAIPYVNRLSDLLWSMARWQEGEVLPTRPRET